MALQISPYRVRQRIAARFSVDRLLFSHPRAVGESYTEHAVIAGRFGMAMILGGLKCLVHAVAPGVQQTAASETVDALHRQLQKRRAAAGSVDHDFVI